MQIERRKFLQDACKACLLAGAGFLISDLAACSPATRITRLPVFRIIPCACPLHHSTNNLCRSSGRKAGSMISPCGKQPAGQYRSPAFAMYTPEKPADRRWQRIYLHPARQPVYGDGQVKKGPSEAVPEKI